MCWKPKSYLSQPGSCCSEHGVHASLGIADTAACIVGVFTNELRKIQRQIMEKQSTQEARLGFLAAWTAYLSLTVPLVYATCVHNHQHPSSRQVFADVGDFPPRGQGGVRPDTANRLVPERKPKGPAEVERHRRMHLDKCFSCFDVLERGRVPSGVVWGGLALMTGAPEVAKVKFSLAMFDADRYVNVPIIDLQRTFNEVTVVRKTGIFQTEEI